MKQKPRIRKPGKLKKQENMNNGKALKHKCFRLPKQSKHHKHTNIIDIYDDDV